MYSVIYGSLPVIVYNLIFTHAVISMYKYVVIFGNLSCKVMFCMSTHNPTNHECVYLCTLHFVTMATPSSGCCDKKSTLLLVTASIYRCVYLEMERCC